MIIINKPYVSDFLIETIKKNDFKVLDNEISKKMLQKEHLINTPKAIDLYKNGEKIYMNSENSLDWINQNLRNEDISKLIEISKDKILFREKLKKIYPNYYFEKIDFNEIKNFNPNNIKFPVVLKPSIGFLSFGVYTIDSENQWNEIINNLESDIEKFMGIFPENVVDTTTFIIEEKIEGDEYAIDAYFDNEGNAVILNIFQHPFFDGKDVSDRAYYTSKAIITKYLDKFQKLLDNIGKIAGYKNFPFHLELRANEEKIIPIEINPMRFCGWCITDIAYFAWGINVYEYFFYNKKPDWENILKNADDDYYYFTIGDLPSGIKNSNIKSVNYDAYLKNISNPLDIRKIDYKHNPVFAIVFGKTNNFNEIKNLLQLKMDKYIEI